MHWHMCIKRTNNTIALDNSILHRSVPKTLKVVLQRQSQDWTSRRFPNWEMCQMQRMFSAPTDFQEIPVQFILCSAVLDLFFFLCFVDTFFFFIKLEWLSWKFPVDAHRVLQLAKKLGYLKFCTVVIKLCLGSPAFNH